MSRKNLPITAEQWLEKPGLPWETPAPRIKSADLTGEISMIPGGVTYVSRKELDDLVVGWS